MRTEQRPARIDKGVNQGDDAVKVLIVTPSYSPVVGGSETLVRAICTKLNELGIATDIMAFNMERKWNPIWTKRIEHNSINRILKIPALNPFPFLRVNPLYYLLRLNVLPRLDFKKEFEEYDLIHFFGEADLSLPFFSRSVRKPKILQCVSIPILAEQFRRHTTMKKLFVRIFPALADIFIAFSSEDRKALLDLGVSQDKVLVWPYGIDTEVFRPDESKKLDNLILFVGRIERIKGLHVFLEALRLLKFKTQAVLIGPASDSEYFKQISRMSLEVEREGVHSIEYLGSMEQHDLLSWYQKATVLVRPDLVGPSGTGIATMEALACGTPVIGVQNHVVRDRVNGRIIQPNNPAMLAESLEEVLKDRELARKYGREGRRIMEEEYNLKTALNKLVQVYESLLSN